MAVLGYLAKSKKGLVLAFGANFLHDFSIKMRYTNKVLFICLSMNKVSMSHIISFSRYQTKCVINFLCRQLMTSKILRFFLDQHFSWKKRGEDENTKI